VSERPARSRDRLGVARIGGVSAREIGSEAVHGEVDESASTGEENRSATFPYVLRARGRGQEGETTDGAAKSRRAAALTGRRDDGARWGEIGGVRWLRRGGVGRRGSGVALNRLGWRGSEETEAEPKSVESLLRSVEEERRRGDEDG
jgi:hypothetical protein